jgi:hypothetical protein
MIMLAGAVRTCNCEVEKTRNYKGTTKKRRGQARAWMVDCRRGPAVDQLRILAVLCLFFSVSSAI